MIEGQPQPAVIRCAASSHATALAVRISSSQFLIVSVEGHSDTIPYIFESLLAALTRSLSCDVTGEFGDEGPESC